MWTKSPSSRFFASLLLVSAHFVGNAVAVEGPPGDAIVPVAEAVVPPAIVEGPYNNAIVDPSAPPPEAAPIQNAAPAQGSDVEVASAVGAPTDVEVPTYEAPIAETVAVPAAPAAPQNAIAEAAPLGVEPVAESSALAYEALGAGVPVPSALEGLQPATESAVDSSAAAASSPAVSSPVASTSAAPTSVVVTSIVPVTSALPVGAGANTTSTTLHNGTTIHSTGGVQSSFTTILVSSVYSTLLTVVTPTAMIPGDPAESGAAVSGIVYTGGLSDPTLDKACWGDDCENPESKMSSNHVITVQQPQEKSAAGRALPVLGAVVGVVGFVVMF